MARNRKNNHYHYSEKFDNRRRRVALSFPKRTVFVAVLFLLVFGIISTTFAAQWSNDAVQSREYDENSVIIDVRTAKAQRDIAMTGANVDLASSGYDVTSGAVIYFFVPTDWDISTYSHVQLMIGRQEWNNDYSACFDMTRIGTSRLYYKSMSAWGNFNQLCFIANSSSWGGENTAPSSRSSTYSHYYTNTWAECNLTATIWAFRADSGTNGDDIHHKQGTANEQNKLLNSSFNIYSYRKNGADAQYSYNGQGGTITASGTTKNANSNTSTSATSATTDATTTNKKTIYPMLGSTVTLTNSPSAGYAFDGYKFDNANTGTTAGTPMVMSSWKDESTNVYGTFHEIMHTVNVANDVNASVSSTASAVGVTTAKQITAPTITGYSFSSWTYNSNQISLTSGTATSSTITFTYKTTATGVSDAGTAVDLTANYTINPPTSVTVSTTVDGDAVSTGNVGDQIDVSSTIAPTPPTGISSNVTYSVSGSGASVTNGVFSATVPGIYTITASATATDGSKTSTAVTGTKTVTVYPAVPSWTLTMSGYEANGDLNNGYAYGTENNPYMVNLGSNFSFTAAVTNPINNYTYTWHSIDSANNDTVLGTGTSLTFGSAQATDATTSNVMVKVYCVAYYNSAANLTTESEKQTKWYYIKSLINSFALTPFQKIYNSPNNASLSAIYNLQNGNGYNTGLWFSADNRNYYEAKHASGLITGFDDVLQRYIYASGVKYFYLNVGNNAGTLNAKTDVVHTTVGASQKSAVKPVYFINDEANTLIDLKPDTDGHYKYRVMVFYVDGNGDLQYQTAQDVYKGVALKRGVRYRAYIPSDATDVSFAICKSGKYAAPTYNGSVLDYSASRYLVDGTSDYTSPFFYAYTGLIELEDGKNTVKATAKTVVSGYSSDDDYSLYSLTTSYLAYQSAE